MKNVEDLTAEDIAKIIREGKATFDELRATGDFDASKQKRVKKMLAVFEEEDNDFHNATTVQLLEDFKSEYPDSLRIPEVNAKIARLSIEERRNRQCRENAAFSAANTVQLLEDFKIMYPDSQYRAEADKRIAQITQAKFDEVRKNINAITPDSAKEILGESFLRELCGKIGLDYDIVDGYDEPELDFSDVVPKKANEIPSGYTDVFFWGIPSSGKSCALSAILNTIHCEYTMDVDVELPQQFGATYRDSLVELFTNNIGYLPPSTVFDRTQYMPFRVKKRGNKERYRNIAFFELSGEIFKFFYDIVNNNVSTDVISYDKHRDEVHVTEEQKREQLRRFAFKTLNLLLNSENRKVHFFFVDYNQTTQKKQEQAKYLNAAATYFRQKNDIFRKKTDAVYIVVTKADEIHAPNDAERSKIAGAFLQNNFGGFMDAMKVCCDEHSVNFIKKIFSIGDVYFSKICKINRKYSIDIINDLLDIVKPRKKSIITDILNS
ncbi:MAG: hypothetical protein FWB85_00905 [Chitinispirillia bacterium]|nr:hypothetical protein [Chitinispirillia bacterium]MCL2241061.1 hypothetical protein [Chitinispirillia bacterium]